MPKRSEAKKTNPLQMFEDGKCTKCGHDFDQHITAPGSNTIDGPFTCPALPPAKSKQVSVDEAVLERGGKPASDFAAQVAAASGEAERKDRLRIATEHFDRQPGEATQLDVEISRLRPMKGNPRGDDLGDVSGLVKSMEMHGFIGTLFVRPIEGTEDFEVWAGNRRLKAAREAGLKVLPCDVYELTEVQALELNMAEQINRADLTPLQEGDACRRLMELAGYTEAQVGEKFGKSASWVTKRVALCGIAPELRKAVAKGDVPVTLANALAALPSQQLQVKAHEALEARPDWEKRRATAETDAQWIRETYCRPLADATWKMTDADLVPEAGACSACPFNSINAKMPGLFDNAKAKPTCARTECFDDKAAAAWLLKTAKLKAAGAKVLSLNESKKLFARGNDLGSASRYVEADFRPPKDKQERAWAELVADMPEEHRPVLHVAQDNGGKLRQLYVLDKAMEAAATHLMLKWAKAIVEEAEERAPTPEKKAKQEAEFREKQLVGAVRDTVVDSVLDQVAAKLAGDFTLPAARFIAGRLGERTVERFAGALGKKKLPKDWVEKGATMSELLAMVWLDDANDELHAWDGYDERLLALAKAHGIDVDAMTKAQLTTARAEAEKGKAP